MSSRWSQLPGQHGITPGWIGRFVTPRAIYVLIAALLLSLAVLGARYHASVRAEAGESILARRLALGQLAAATLSERLDRMADLAGSLATRVRFAELVGAGQWEAAAAILRQVPAEFPHVERLFLSDVRGTLMVDVPPLSGVRGRNLADRDWYQGVSREWKIHVSAVYRRAAEPQRNAIAVAAPIRAGGRVAGILVLQLSPDALFDWARAIDLAEGVSLAVVDPKGQAAYASGASTQGPIADLSGNHAVQQVRQGRSGVEVGGDSLYAFVAAKHGWSVVIEQPASAAFAARDLQLRLVWISYGLVALFLAMVTWLGARLAGERRQDLARARRTVARHSERLRMLHEIDGAIVAQQSPEAIAAAVIRPLRELLDVPRAIVNRFDLEAGEVEWIAAAGRRRMHVGPGVRYSIRLMGEVEALRRGEPQRVDVHTLPHGPEREALLASDVHVYMVMPMIAGGELIGALSFGSHAADFPAEKLNIAQEVATQLAIAISQARLHEKVKRHAEELELRVAERTAALEAAKAELEDLYNNAPCGYHSVGRHGKFVRMNDTELRWLGYTREELVDRMGPADLHTAESLKLFHERFERFKQTGIAQDVEYDLRRKDGSILPVLLNATAVRDANGEFLMSRSTVLDNSERKRAREEIEAANRELESFSYSVSHDLRAPLRAIDGFAGILEGDYGARLDDEGRRLLGVVRSSSKHMGQLIDDLLDFSRLGRLALGKRHVDMTSLAREAAQALPLGGARLDIAPLPHAHADRALLRQVWSNLLGNALKYSSKRADARIEVGGRKEAGESVYWVRDNGVGFDMRYAEKLFGVFQRLHGMDEFPGTGVGLAIVQRVVARHGGRVWAEGRVGEGACFYFALPEQADG